jgi:hypothetical protein
MRSRFLVVSLLAGVLVLLSLVAGCDSNGGTKRVVCDYAMDSGTFTGRLTALDGRSATFTVTHTTPNPQAVRAPLAKDATKVVVRYGQGDEQLLTIGKDYKVKVTPTGTAGATTYVSSIHRKEHPCSGGTTYADGTAIAS